MTYLATILLFGISINLSIAADDYSNLFDNSTSLEDKWCRLTGTCDSWRTKSFRITCCANGRPQLLLPNNASYDHETSISNDGAVVNFTSEDTGSATSFDDGCRRFKGSYRVNQSALGEGERVDVNCHCPHSTSNDLLDRNCRHIRTECMNGGTRRFSLNLRCACPTPFFGALCQFECRNGVRMTGTWNTTDYCRCRNLWFGPTCSETLCTNGGTPSGPVCWCPPSYHGQRCQFRMTGVTDAPDGEVHQALRRDFTGTVISLVLVVTLLTSMYCMLRRRLQVAQRRQHIIDELIQQHMQGRSANMQMRAAMQLHQHNMPPEYTTSDDGGTYPPLPTYDDLIKSSISAETQSTELEMELPPPEYNIATSSNSASPVEEIIVSQDNLKIDKSPQSASTNQHDETQAETSMEQSGSHLNEVPLEEQTSTRHDDKL